MIPQSEVITVCVRAVFFSSVYSMFFSVVPSFPTSSSVGPYMRLGSVCFLFSSLFRILSLVRFFVAISVISAAAAAVVVVIVAVVLLIKIQNTDSIHLSLSFAQCKAQIGGKCFGFTLW